MRAKMRHNTFWIFVFLFCIDDNNKGEEEEVHRATWLLHFLRVCVFVIIYSLLWIAAYDYVFKSEKGKSQQKKSMVDDTFIQIDNNKHGV